MKYVLLYIPLILLVLAYGYNRKYHRLLSTGRIPDVLAASRRAKLFLMLAVLTSLVIVVVFNFS